MQNLSPPNTWLADVVNRILKNRFQEKAVHELYNVVDGLPFGVAVLLGKSLTIGFINRFALGLSDAKQEDALGKSFFEVFTHLQSRIGWIHEEVYSTVKQVVANEISLDLFTDERWQTRYFKYVVEPLKDDAGEIFGELVISMEITDHVEARNKLKESEGAFLSWANGMPHLVWIAQANGEVTYYNDRLELYAGALRNSSGEWDWTGILHPDDLEDTIKAWELAYSQQIPFEAKHRLRMRDGVYHWHVSRAIPKHDPFGRLVKWHGTATDIHSFVARNSPQDADE